MSRRWRQTLLPKNDLPEPEYMNLHLLIIPKEIIDEYTLHNLVD